MDTREADLKETIPSVAVFLDLENILTKLLRSGIRPSPEVLIHAIRKQIADLGKITTFTAYAEDWREIQRETKYDFEHALYKWFEDQNVTYLWSGLC